MPELDFRIEGAAVQPFAAVPTLLFKLRVTESVPTGKEPTPVHTVALRCQIRIEPGRRQYSRAEQKRLLDLFGTPERWGQTVRPMLWTHVGVVVPPFTGTTAADLPVPCSFDFSLAATRYFSALDDGEMPLCFLFSGTIFCEREGRGLQVAQISWEKEAYFSLPAAAWRGLTVRYYPNSAWLCVRKDVFDALDGYRGRWGVATASEALERLLNAAGEPVTP
jgi:hypothetical protein